MPVVAAADGGGRPTIIRPSRMGKRRAAVLILLYVAFIGHLLHWRLTGRTLSPVEPSETMETLESGRVNAGAIFFAAALASTLLFGRFVCGWGCHIVALQDLCGWLLRKLGLRPRPFRSRLLMWVPLVAALYMFVWPTAYRWWMGAAAPAWTAHLTRQTFWATFPGPIVGTLTLLVCGFVIVYFLGNKGFCTYACPYGGFFGVLDKLSPTRIRVTDACNQCGHCTAVCTSNVRVAEEVKLFKAVVDPGCMKCMDCVSVCPNDALYLGFGAPALLTPRPATPRRSMRFDGSWAEEIVLAIVFLACLLSYRGLYGQVPFLFALGLSAVTSYLLLKAWQLWLRRDLTLHGLILKRSSRLTGRGFVFASAAAALVAFVAHGGFINYNQWRGERSFERVTGNIGIWPLASRLRPMIAPDEAAVADTARVHFARVERWGLLDMASVQSDLTWLDLLNDDPASAERRARHLVASTPDSAAAHVSLAAILLHRDRTDDARVEYERAAALAPDDPEPQFGLGLTAWRRGDFSESTVRLEKALALGTDRSAEMSKRRPLPTIAHYCCAEALRRAGRLDESLAYETQPHAPSGVMAAVLARALLLMPDMAGLHRAMSIELARGNRLDEAAAENDIALKLDPADFNARMQAARLRMRAGDAEEAVRQYRAVEQTAPHSWTVQLELLGALAGLGRYDDAMACGRKAESLQPRSSLLAAQVGAVLLARGDLPAATAELRRAVQLDPADPEYKMRLGWLLARQNQPDEAAALFRIVADCGRPDLANAARQALRELGAGAAR